MSKEQKIVIGERILTREELFKEKEHFRKKRAMQSFEDKIKALIELQKIAYYWGRKKDTIIWKI
ncbi:MAG: hypothetical protein A2Y62_19360 [Candidatus Fischerbacteria bacterium RBG_13_37_8]|uniref:Uncharacterized protein n=1 Tax=Candidatus Fischerbacteria bacterium RBG_13_37_8 TaxID=1817863 RepID=A0A1F5VX62_9BACT|nr:MAG: hypothetical protein A2Y62_19360 [Candidatus Fischerbacteria bacterium RBG_13_37_8]